MTDDQKGFGAGAVVLSFLAGAAIATGLTLLLAPRSGRDTRKKIRRAVDDAVDSIREYKEEAQVRLKEAYEEGRDSIIEKKSMLKSALEAGREAMEKERQKRA